MRAPASLSALSLCCSFALGCSPEVSTGQVESCEFLVPPGYEGVLDVSCEGAPSPAHRPPLFSPAGEPADYPFVLVHGFLSGSARLGFGDQVVEALRGDGHTVSVVEVPPFAPMHVRSSELGRQIRTILGETGAERVHVMAHSMGGLDARHLMCLGDGGPPLDFYETIATLTTFSTPHWGTRMADRALEVSQSASEGIVQALLELVNSAYLRNAAHGRDDDVRAALLDMSEAAAHADRPGNFNERCPQADPNKYFSYAALSTPHAIHSEEIEFYERLVCEGQGFRHDGTAAETPPIFYVSTQAIFDGPDPNPLDAENPQRYRPNDGVVTVESSKWGRFLGCVPADHYTEIGIKDLVAGSDFVESTGFSASDFLRHHAFWLAARE